jgi:hypothetical protein
LVGINYHGSDGID